MKVFYSDKYISSATAFETTRKAGWVASSFDGRPMTGLEIVEPFLPPRRSGLSHSSFTSFGCGSAMPAVCASTCHRPSIHHPPVGHGRGLASRPGCAGPREGIDSARRSSMPEERASSNVLVHSSASTGPASFLPDPDHASVIRNSNKVQKKQPPHPKRRAAVAAEACAISVFAPLPAVASTITSSYVM